MRRALRIGALLFLVLLVSAGVFLWNLAFRAPTPQALPLPAGLVAAGSPEGRRLLAEGASTADYDALSRAFEPQSRPGFCGVASGVILLNALRGQGARMTQADFFTDAAAEVRSSWAVTFGGMALHELEGLLRAHGLDATAVHASDTRLADFRTQTALNLETPGDFLLVNYQRGALGQEPTGHISPVGAYNPAADKALVMDVSSYKYPWVWVSTEALWGALDTGDPSSGRSRGYVTVRDGGAAPRTHRPPPPARREDP